MTFIDAIIVLIVLGGLAVGYRKGLIRQTASFVRWILGIMVCLFLGDEAVKLFMAINPEAAQWPLAGITVRPVVLAFMFCVITLVLRVITGVTRKAVRAVKLGCLDKWGGAAFFVFKYMFVLSVSLNLLYAYNPDAETFATRHMLDNQPYEATINLMPRLLGAETLPGDSLALYRMNENAQGHNDNKEDERRTE